MSDLNPLTALATQQPTAEQEPQAQPDPNNENLPEGLQKALWTLTNSLETQDELPRRREVRAILQRRLFYRGEQYWSWSETQGVWYSPNEVMPSETVEQDQPAFQHVTNIFQAFVSSLMSVLSQNMVAARFWPQSPSNPKDTSTAESADKVIDLIHRNNDMQNKADDATYFLCTDGYISSFTRYVADGERFGHDEQDVLAPQDQQISAEGVGCPQCGNYEDGSIDQMPVCPECGYDMVSVPAETAQVPMPTGETQKIPRGQEVITIVPALQLKRSMWADEQKDFLYLTWITDIHKALAQNTYANVADKIEGSTSGDNGSGETYEKLARRLLYVGSGRHAGADMAELGTFRRTWLRRSAFWKVKDTEQRAQLVEMFPDGVYVAFYNDIYCESRNECMDEKWEGMHGMPGEGQFRETLVSNLVPIQEQLNDATNLLFEQGMCGTPEAFADENVLDFEARNKQASLPGQMTPVDLKPNEDIRQKVWFSQAIEPSVALTGYKDQLFGPVPQFLSGVFPALFGGDTGGNDTASGIAQQRNQAMGRIGRAWRRLQVFWANTDAKAVRCFAQNRTKDVEIAVLGDGGDYKSEWVRLEDLKGNIAAYPEIDQQYPVLQSEVSGLILSLLENANPLFMAVAQEPSNLEYVLKQIGLVDIEVPGQQQRVKTYGIIDQLIEEAPTPTGTADPMTGVPNLLPTVQPNPDVDNLSVCADTTKKWLISPAGLRAQTDNPKGYANVLLYLQACVQMGKSQELQTAIAAQGISGTGPGADLGGSEDVPPPPDPNAPPADSAPE